MKQTMVTVALVLSVFFSAVAQKSDIYVVNGKAIGGYDPVAFFSSGKAVKGNEKFAYSWHGAQWLFATAQNLDSFKASPEKYAPQYGGYCAYGAAEGHKAPTQPDTWTIVDGKLYFNYNKDVKQLWVKDQEGNIKKADENWPNIKDKE